MSRSGDAQFGEFFGQQYRALVRYLAGHEVSGRDAEDAAQETLTRMFPRWAQVREPRAYLYRAAANEASALARRERVERAKSSRLEPPISEDVYHRGEIAVVRQSLALLPPRQRQVMAEVYAGYRISEIAEAHGITPATVRNNLRHARNTLRPLVGDREELWLRLGQKVYEAWRRGERPPAEPRLLIGWAWERAKALGMDPEHGTAVTLLNQDEVERRRRRSPLATCPWVLDTLAELGSSTGEMVVVADADATVLWRGGDPWVLRQADKVGFIEGARWDLAHAGVGGIALALATGRTVKVCRWEHTARDQQGLSCAATPVRDPRDGRVLCFLNVTGTRTTVPRAMLREIDTLATRLHQQLRTLWTPHV